MCSITPQILAGLRKFGMDLVHPDMMAVIIEACYEVCKEYHMLLHSEFFLAVCWRLKSHKISKTKIRGCLETLWNVGCITKIPCDGRMAIACVYVTVDEIIDAFNRGLPAILPPPGIGCYYDVDTRDVKKLLLGF